MDIREFYKQTQQNQTKNTNDFSSSNQNSQNFNSQNNFENNSNSYSQNKNSTQDFSAYQDTINKYKDLSQEDLYSELFSQANDLKAQGKLDTNMLEQISATLLPVLNNEQKQLLENIMNKLK